MLFNISSQYSVKIRIDNEAFTINKGSNKIEVDDKYASVFKERLKVYGLVYHTEAKTDNNKDKEDKKALFKRAKELELKPEFNATIEQLKAMIEDAEQKTEEKNNNLEEPSEENKDNNIDNSDNGDEGNS